MTVLVVLPFSLPDPGTVAAGEWSDDHGPLGDRITDWEFNTPVSLSRPIRVDAPTIRDQCGLPDDAPLRLSATWHSSTTNLRGILASRTVSTDPVELTARLPGVDLGGVLSLTTLLTLDEALPTTEWSPHMAGTVLWRDERRVSLEGIGTMFPMEVTRFGVGTPYPSGAAWVLEWSGDDLAAPSSAAVRLHINRDHTAVRRAVEAAGDPDPESRAILSALQFDISRSLIFGALANEDFVSGSADYDDGALGSAVRRLLALHWPAESAEALRTRLERQPAILEAELQERLRLFAE